MRCGAGMAIVNGAAVFTMDEMEAQGEDIRRGGAGP